MCCIIITRHVLFHILNLGNNGKFRSCIKCTVSTRTELFVISKLCTLELHSNEADNDRQTGKSDSFSPHPKRSAKLFWIEIFQCQFWNQSLKMHFLQVLLKLSIFLSFLMSTVTSDEQLQTANFKMVRCNISDKFVYPNISCFAKSFNRSHSTMSILEWAKQPLNKIFVSRICIVLMFILTIK